MRIGSIVRRVVFGLAVAIAVGGYGGTRWVVEHHRVVTSGDAALVNLWLMGVPASAPGKKAMKPTSEQFGGAFFVMAIGLGVAGAIALPGRVRPATPA